MQKSQKGFTLIELIVVIVLLGILGVTALGKFQNLSAQAADAAEQGVASELSSAAAVNFGSRLLGGAGTAITVAGCVTAGAPHANLNALLATGTAPTTNYTYAFVSGDVAEGAACTSGQTYICSVTNSQGTAGGANATIICVP